MSDQIWKMYTDGRIEVAKETAQLELSKDHDEVIKQGLHAILAWCSYRRNQYPEALQEIALAGETQRAKECHAYILAYAEGYTNDPQLLALIQELEGNVNATNALVIRARATNSVITHEQVWSLAEKFASSADVAQHDVSLANLLNNCARFFQDKARDRRDLKFALGLMEIALAHYGQISNWHHRAGANFWMSHILEALTAIPEAYAAASASLLLWMNQIVHEKKTKPFIEKMGSARDRVAELAEKLVKFADRAHG